MGRAELIHDQDTGGNRVIGHRAGCAIHRAAGMSRLAVLIGPPRGQRSFETTCCLLPFAVYSTSSSTTLTAGLRSHPLFLFTLTLPSFSFAVLWYFSACSS